MRLYNLYYKGDRLNRRPLTKDDLDAVLSKEKVSKIVNSSKHKDVLVKDCKIVECILV